MSIQLKDHLDYLDEVDKIITGGQINRLINYTNFSLCRFFRYGLRKIIRINNKKIIKHVINNMTSIDYSDYENYSLIHILTLYSENTNLLNYLIEKYRFDLEIKTNYYSKPIHYAFRNKKVKNIKLLIDKGVDLEAQKINGMRPVHLACEEGLVEIVKILIDKGVDLEAQESNSMRPIHYACTNRSWEIVEILVNADVNINSKDDYGMPIHYACLQGSFETIKLLITRGANIESKNISNWNSVHLACANGTFEIIKYLLIRDIDLNSRINIYNGNVVDYGIDDLLMLNDKLTTDNKTELLQIIAKKKAEFN